VRDNRSFSFVLKVTDTATACVSVCHNSNIPLKRVAMHAALQAQARALISRTPISPSRHLKKPRRSALPCPALPGPAQQLLTCSLATCTSFRYSRARITCVRQLPKRGCQRKLTGPRTDERLAPLCHPCAQKAGTEAEYRALPVDNIVTYAHTTTIPAVLANTASIKYPAEALYGACAIRLATSQAPISNAIHRCQLTLRLTD
jgi:hypothetical protein